jgi:hypothetical protein
MIDLDLAWLAGLIDGEGSIGLGGPQTNNNSIGYKQSIQLNMTHKPTIDRAMEIVIAIGCRGQTYTYTEKKSHHADAHLLTVRRLWDIRLLAREMIRFSVTKRLHWALMLEFADSRLDGANLDADGRVVRGGNAQWWKPFTEREHEIAVLLMRENRRGRKDLRADPSWASNQRTDSPEAIANSE